MSQTETLLLDPDIRDWVVLPLFGIMILAGLLRQAVGMWLAGAPEVQPLTVQRSTSTLKSIMRLRMGGARHALTAQQAVARRAAACLRLEETAVWLETFESTKAEDEDPMAAMMGNPMGMMKGNMAFMVQNMVMMQGIQHFFSGFILLKVPFPLTAGFKSMFQKGLTDMPDLEPSYVSSVSWYFLVMYGLRAFLKLLVGEPGLEMREQDRYLTSTGWQKAAGPGGKQDKEALAQQLRTEAESIEVMPAAVSELDRVEKRLLGKRYPTKKLDTGGGADFWMDSNTKASSKKKR